MTYKEKARDIYVQLQQGQLLEAFDKYYAEDVVMTEPRGTRNGKAECRAYEEQFLNNIEKSAINVKITVFNPISAHVNTPDDFCIRLTI